MKVSKFHNLISWLDQNLLFLFTCFLIAFIPLYPKLPLFEAIPGYIVRVRLEDLIVFLTALFWLVQVKRQKLKWNTPTFWLVLLYTFSACLSILFALFVIKSVPLELIHFGKTFLHFLRYLEYFAVFFIVFSVIRNYKQAIILLTIFVVTSILIAIYGYGQKYYYWPVYSTMNREFSKGLRLYLTEHARVQSTFGGHYDLAAYLVIVLTFIYALAINLKNKIIKFFLYLSYLLSLWLMVVSASRSSFIAYLIALLIVIIISALNQQNRLKKILFFIKHSFVSLILISVMMLSFGTDMYERFLQILEAYPTVHYFYHDTNAKRKALFDQFFVQLGLKKPSIPRDAISLEDAQKLEHVLVPSDQRPVSSLPSDVYVNVPDYVKIATISAEGETTYIIVEKDRTWSANALKYGLSVAIRLDELWPNAIKGFSRDPLFGSGYATLNKKSDQQFTEAESTDNNFLRTLGETGLFGFIFFYGIIVINIIIAFKFVHYQNIFISALSIGFIAASIGLLLNATYIDVYASSKVAFTYWILTGLTLGIYYLEKKQLLKIAIVNWFNQQSQKILIKLRLIRK